jgi:hypothetical protein
LAAAGLEELRGVRDFLLGMSQWYSSRFTAGRPAIRCQ